MKPKIFIDGAWGTTGLVIQEKLAKRDDIELVAISEEQKKDSQKKSSIIEKCDLVILCLPDEIAKKTALSINTSKTKIIDASSAHRIENNWCYGFPEMSKHQRKLIKNSRKVANVGCYASAIIALLKPLLSQNLVSKEHFFVIHALSGYSGGGKKLIAEYTQKKLPTQNYGLQQNHKHIPEIMKYTELKNQPYFLPSVGDFAQGMLVHIPFFSKDLQHNASIDTLVNCYQNYYQGENFIEINSQNLQQNGFLRPTICNHTNKIKIEIFGNQKIFSIVAVLDNLGKGACGSAIQNLNLMLGFEENTGL